MAAVGGLAAPAMLLAQRRRDTYTDPGEMERAMATLEERFWSKVEKSDGCWLWTAATDTKGYGNFSVCGHATKAHRVAYELVVGPIPTGLCIDHLCRTPTCVNPAHLEPVTNEENIMRGVGFSARNKVKTHCPSGHPYSGDNLLNRGSRRGCAACRRRDWATYRARHRAEVPS